MPSKRSEEGKRLLKNLKIFAATSETYGIVRNTIDAIYETVYGSSPPPEAIELQKAFHDALDRHKAHALPYLEKRFDKREI